MPLGKGSEVAIAVGVGAAALVGFFVYLDYKRRSSPGYKDSIRQKRRQMHNENNEFGRLNTMNPSEVQSYFMEELSKGEDLLNQGNPEGATHVANAIAMMEMPQQVLGILSQTMPPEQFSLIVSKIPEARQKFLESRGIVNIPNFANAEENNEDALAIGEILDDDDLE